MNSDNIWPRLTWQKQSLEIEKVIKEFRFWKVSTETKVECLPRQLHWQLFWLCTSHVLIGNGLLRFCYSWCSIRRQFCLRYFACAGDCIYWTNCGGWESNGRLTPQLLENHGMGSSTESLLQSPLSSELVVEEQSWQYRSNIIASAMVRRVHLW